MSLIADKARILRYGALLGAGLTVLNTLVSVMTDALAKDLVADHPAPQLMAMSGILAVMIGLGLAATGGARRRMILHTASPKRVALRSVFGAASTIGFFLALRDLPFVELFLFMGLMPLFGAVLSGLVLGETVRGGVWLALAGGMLGMAIIIPDGMSGMTQGHLYGLFATLTGAASIVLSRGICRSHTHAFAQVFYAQIACALLGMVILPFVWQPMAAVDIGLLVLYTLSLLTTRWLMVVIVRLLPAYVVMQIANIQFVWMVLVGHTVFGEVTGPHVWLGSALVIASGLWLIRAQRAPAPVPAAASVPAE